MDSPQQRLSLPPGDPDNPVNRKSKPRYPHKTKFVSMSKTIIMITMMMTMILFVKADTVQPFTPFDPSYRRFLTHQCKTCVPAYTGNSQCYANNAIHGPGYVNSAPATTNIQTSVSNPSGSYELIPLRINCDSTGLTYQRFQLYDSDCSSAPPSHISTTWTEKSNFATTGRLIITTNSGVSTGTMTSVDLCVYGDCVCTMAGQGQCTSPDTAITGDVCIYDKQIFVNFSIKICTLPAAIVANGDLIPLNTISKRIVYTEDTGWQTDSTMTSFMTSTETTYCPIVYINIWTYDAGTNVWTNVTQTNTNFRVPWWTTNLYTSTANVVPATEYYIAGYTAGEVLQDYIKIELTVCGEQIDSVGTEITSAYAYKWLSSNPTQLTWSQYIPRYATCIKIDSYSIDVTPSKVTAYPTVATSCAESPCRTIDYDTSTVTTFRFRVKFHYTAVVGSGFTPSRTSTRSSWIKFYVQEYVVEPYILPPVLGGTATNYLMLLNSNGAGAVDSVYNYQYRFGSFTCNVASGCPDPSGQTLTWTRTSQSGSTIVPHGTVPDPVWSAVDSKWSVQVTTTTLTSFSFYIASAWPKDDDSQPCAKENGECACAQPSIVYYGAQRSSTNTVIDSTRVYRQSAPDADGSTTCSNARMGGDPISGTVKYCWCGLQYFGSAVGTYSNLVTVQVICGSEAAAVDVNSYVLPVSCISMTSGDFNTFDIPSIFTYTSNEVQCPITTLDIYQNANSGTPLDNSNIVLQNPHRPTSGPLWGKIKYFIDNSYKISFYIRGSTDGRFYNDGAFVKVTIIVCGGETLSLSSEAQSEGPHAILFNDDTLHYHEVGKTDTIRSQIYDGIKPWFEFTVGPSDISCRSKDFSILGPDCISPMTPYLASMIQIAGTNVSTFTMTIDISKPLANTQFCLLETTLGAVSIGRQIEYEVCGLPIILNKNDTTDDVYRYGVDRSMKENKIKFEVYSSWFQNPSVNCTIIGYQIVEAMNPREDLFGLIDIYDPTHFKAMAKLFNEILYINETDFSLVINKEASILHIPVQWDFTEKTVYLQAFTSGGHVVNQRMNFKFIKNYNVQPTFPKGIGKWRENTIEVDQFDQLNGNTDWFYYKMEMPEDYEGNDPLFKIQNKRNETCPWLSVVLKGGSYYFKVDTMWVTLDDHGENIMTLSLYDEFSSDDDNLYPISYTIDYKQFDMVATLPDGRLAQPDIEMKDGPDPQIYMTLINQNHTFNLTFDLDMEVFQYNNYTRMIQIKAVDQYYSQETLGVPMQEFPEEDMARYWRVYFFEKLPDWVSRQPWYGEPLSPKDTPPNLNFKWDVILHTPGVIMVKLYFEDTDQVSISTYDTIKVTLIENDNLRASDTMRPVIIEQVLWQYCAYKEGQLCRRIPPYLALDVTGNIDSADQVQEWSIKALFGTQLLLAILLGSALQKIFDVIRPVQYLGLIILCQIVFPGNLYGFFIKLMERIHFDMFETAGAFDDKSTFITQDPLSDAFEEFQIDNMNYLMSSGSIILPVIPGLFFYQIVIVQGIMLLSTKYHQSKMIRKVGLKMSEKKQDIMPQIVKVMYEAYLELTMGTALNFLAIYYAIQKDKDVYFDTAGALDDEETLRNLAETEIETQIETEIQTESDLFVSEFLKHFATLPDAVCTVLTFLSCAFYVLGLPAYVYYRTRVDYPKFNEEREEYLQTGKKAKDEGRLYGTQSIFWDEIKTDKYSNFLMPVFFMLRRFVSIFIVVYFRNQPMFQVFPLLVMSVMNCSYILWSVRFKDKGLIINTNHQEIVNEVIVYITLVTFLVFTNVSLDIERKENIGWFVIFIISFNMFQIIILKFIEIILESIEECKNNKIKKQLIKDETDHIKNRQLIVEQFPGKFPQFEEFLKERDVIEDCRAWKVHRDFLGSLHVNIDEMPEEIVYQRALRIFKFKQRMLIIKNNATMRHLFKLDFIKEFNQKVMGRIAQKVAPEIEQKVQEEEEPIELMDTDEGVNGVNGRGDRIIIQMNRNEIDTTSKKSNDIAQSIKDGVESSLNDSDGSNVKSNVGSSVRHSNRMSQNASSQGSSQGSSQAKKSSRLGKFSKNKKKVNTKLQMRSIEEDVEGESMGSSSRRGINDQKSPRKESVETEEDQIQVNDVFDEKSVVSQSDMGRSQISKNQESPGPDNQSDNESELYGDEDGDGGGVDLDDDDVVSNKSSSHSAMKLKGLKENADDNQSDGGSQYSMVSEFTNVMVDEEEKESQYTTVEQDEFEEVEQSEFGFEEVTVSGGPEGTAGVTGETNSKFFMSTGTGFADGINVDVMQDINEQADLEHYGPTIKHVFRHELDLVPVKPKNARVRNTAVASEDNNEAKDVHIKVFDQSRDYRTDIIKLKVQKDSFIKILVGSRVLPDEELIAKSSLEQGYWNKMENKMKKKLAKTDRLTYEAMDSELKLMEKEITNMELETKETFFEHRELYKHLSIHDYEEVLMLNDNRNELRDFNFLPRWDENFVKEVNQAPFLLRQKQIKVGNINFKKYKREDGVFVKPYHNAGVIGIVNKGNYSYLNSLFQCILAIDQLKQYYIDEKNYQHKINPNYDFSTTNMLNFLTDMFRQVYMMECNPLKQISMQLKFKRVTIMQKQHNIPNDPLTVFTYMINMINVYFRPIGDEKFRDSIEDLHENQYQEKVIKLFKKSNCSLLSKMFRQLYNQKVRCPHCKHIDYSYIDSFYIDLIQPLASSKTIQELMQEFFQQSEQHVEVPFNCENCSKLVEIGVTQRNFIQTPPILMFKINKFDEEGNLIGLGELEIHKQVDLLQLKTDETKAIQEALWESGKNYESGLDTSESLYNHSMQRKIDEKMRNSNNYELVAVICHSGRSKVLGEFYSFVKRGIKLEFLSEDAQKLLQQSKNRKPNNNNESEEISVELSDKGDDDDELIILDRPYYIRRYPMTSDDFESIEKSRHILGHMLDGPGELNYNTIPTPSPDPAIAEEKLLNYKFEDDSIFQKKKKLYFKYNRASFKIDFMNVIDDDRELDSDGNIIGIEFGRDGEIIENKTIREFAELKLYERLQVGIDKFNLKMVGIYKNFHKMRKQQIDRQRKTKEINETDLEAFGQDLTKSEVYAEPSLIFKVFSFIFSCVLEPIQRCLSRSARLKMEKEQVNAEKKGEKIKLSVEEQAEKELNAMKGKEDIWFDFVDDYHRQVDFKFVAENAKTHGYVFIYQNAYTDDQYETFVQRLEQAEKEGVNDETEILVTYDGDEEFDEQEERFDFINDMFKTSSSFGANAFAEPANLGKSMTSFKGEFPSPDVSPGISDNKSLLSKSNMPSISKSKKSKGLRKRKAALIDASQGKPISTEESSQPTARETDETSMIQGSVATGAAKSGKSGSKKSSKKKKKKSKRTRNPDDKQEL